MSSTFNVYCDESCHLEHDGQTAMVLGAVWCPHEKTREISTRIREIQAAHCLSSAFEVKWTKVSPAKLEFYRDVLDYFFDDDDLHFRALVVPDKSVLSHDTYRQSHDTWYYKMYFDLLKVILNPNDRYRIYLDVKDTVSSVKVAKLHDVLCHSVYDFSGDIIERLQTVRSQEVKVLQLTDLLIGAVSYANRGLQSSAAKSSLVERMRTRAGYTLTKTTLLRETKTNIFVWQASESQA